MKSSYKIVLALVAALSLTNCKVNGNGEVIVTGDPDDPRNSYAIEYSNGGWFPGPSLPNFDLNLKVKIDEKGRAYATAETPECKASAFIDIKKYDELEDLALSADYTFGESHGVDGGDEKLVVRARSADSVYFLRNGDSTYNQRIFKPSDADIIRGHIDAIAEDVFEQSDCEVVYGADDVVKVRIRQNIPDNFSANMMWDPSTSLNAEDITVTIQGDAVILDGFRSTFTGKKECRTVLEKETVRNQKLVALAQKLKIYKSPVVCMAQMALGFGPRSFQLTYGDKSVETGYAFCAYANRIENSEAFDKELDKYTNPALNGSCTARK